MLPEIELEALRHYDRPALERLQMHSRYLRDLVDRHVRTLALRYIHDVDVTYGAVDICLIEEQKHLIRVQAPDEQGLEMLFYRINNAFIRRLTFSFDPADLPLPRHLQEKANDLQCQVRALRIEGRAAEIDYALLDFVGAHLRPQVYETTIVDIPDYVMLFSYKALRGNIKHLEYDGRKLNGPPAPDCIIPALFGVDVIETCAITTEIDPRPWICKFVEMFETAARGTDVVRSVTLIHTRLFEERPVRLADDLLGRPLCKEVPTPHNACVKEWSRVNHLIYGTTSTESAVAELFVFDNPNLAKKLELFAWTIEQVHCSAGISMHYAFLLRVVDM